MFELFVAVIMFPTRPPYITYNDIYINYIYVMIYIYIYNDIYIYSPQPFLLVS